MSASAWLLCFFPADFPHSLLFSLWVHLHCWPVSPLLTLFVIWSPGCGCLSFVALFLRVLSHWHCLSYKLQDVSASAWLLYLSSADTACPLLSRLWVPLLSCYAVPQLTLPVLCSSVCECLCIASVFLPWWHGLSTASRMWEPLLGCYAFPNLISPVLCFAVCDCLCFVALFLPSWHCLSSAFQDVSASAQLLWFSPVEIACLVLFSLWVSLLCCSVSPLLTVPVLCFLGCESLCLVDMLFPSWCCFFSVFQDVSVCVWLPYLSPADITCPFLFRK